MPRSRVALHIYACITDVARVPRLVPQPAAEQNDLPLAHSQETKVGIRLHLLPHN